MEPVTLRTERLVLSPPTEADVDTIAELCQDEGVQRWTTVPSPYSRDDAVGFIGMIERAWESGSGHTWALRSGEDSTVMGMIGLDGHRDDAAELGFWLGSQHRGAGLMTEAADAVCTFGFRDLGLKRIVWHALLPNAASASVARKLGFRYEGLERLGAVQRGRRVDQWQASLLADDPRDDAGAWPADTYGEYTS